MFVRKAAQGKSNSFLVHLLELSGLEVRYANGLSSLELHAGTVEPEQVGPHLNETVHATEVLAAVV